MSNITNDIPELPLTIIEPDQGWVGIRFKELWAYRELLYFLTWRDIKVRYKQTILGALWAILQPLGTMLVFSIFFGDLANIPSDDVPYPIFSYTALVPWTFFASGLNQASNSLLAGSSLLKKVYFPRLTLPISSILGGLVDFVLAFGVLLIMMLIYQTTITVNILLLPAFMLIAICTTLGIGLLMSAMNVQFRDIRYVIPFTTQFLLFATPIAYSSSLIESDVVRTLYGINPMVGVVEGFRWALLGTETIHVPTIILSAMISVVLLIVGLFYFRRMEKSFADVV